MEVLKTMGKVDLFSLLVNKISQVVPATTNIGILGSFHTTIQNIIIAYLYDKHHEIIQGINLIFLFFSLTFH